jgi:photosystem II stability/assembly factor-like uncharacterized protein
MKSLLLFFFFSLIALNNANSQEALDVWTQTYNNGGRLFGIVINPTNQNTMYIAGLDSGVYKTSNGGLTWTQMNNGMSYFHVQCLAISASNPSTLYAGTDSLGSWTTCGVYKSTDAGANWTLVSQDIYDTKSIQTIVVHPTNPNIVYCGVFNAVATSLVGVWKTTNGGTNWIASSTGMDNKQVLCMAFNPLNPNVLYVGTSMMSPSASTGPCKVFRTNDAGATWTAVVNGIPQASTDNNPVRCLSVSNLDTSVVLAGLFENATALTGGMYLTSNGGQLWAKKHTGLVDTVNLLPRACLIKPGSSTEFFVGLDRSAGTGSIGVYRSTNAGTSWTSFNGGAMLSTYSVRVLAYKTSGNPTLFAGCSSTTGGRGLFDYSWLASGISNSNSGIPTTYDLSQNYPNPFNPVTQISFQLPVSGYVKISVYDILGREITVLVNDYMKAGYYDVGFNGSEFSSGIYFYRMYSEKYVSTKKMILTK